MSFNKGIVWLQFSANQSSISRNLCVNKLKPLLHCNGKCQLAKKMEEEDQGKSTGTSLKWQTGFDESDLPGNFTRPCPAVTATSIRYTTNATTSYYQSPVFSIFHPPA